MKRYRLNGVVLLPSQLGAWVKWEDAQSEITRLKNKIKGLENTIDYLKQRLNKKRNLSGDH